MTAKNILISYQLKLHISRPTTKHSEKLNLDDFDQETIGILNEDVDGKKPFTNALHSVMKKVQERIQSLYSAKKEIMKGNISLSPSEAYGEYKHDKDHIVTSKLTADLKLQFKDHKKGDTVQMQNGTVVRIMDKSDSRITLDFNSPYAGCDVDASWSNCKIVGNKGNIFQVLKDHFFQDLLVRSQGASVMKEIDKVKKIYEHIKLDENMIPNHTTAIVPSECAAVLPSSFMTIKSVESFMKNFGWMKKNETVVYYIKDKEAEEEKKEEASKETEVKDKK